MTLDLLTLAAGCFCAFIGGELFLRGILGLAAWWRLPAGLVAATLGAFATSSPEFFVAVSAAMEGKPDIAMGDILGSSLVNIALVLGLPLAFLGMAPDGARLTWHHAFALMFCPLLAYLAWDNVLSRSDAAILVCFFFIWMTLIVWTLRRTQDEVRAPASGGASFLAVACVGLLILFLAGQLIVSGAVSIAATIGFSGFLVGVTIVALGTSVPELSTVIVSMIRGHNDVGLNTALGSNVFNGLFILPVAAAVAPIALTFEHVAPALLAGALATLFLVPVAGRPLGRWRGATLILVYAAFVILMFKA